MLEYLYLVFIAPLEWIMQTSLVWGFEKTGSYGLGIIFMSLVVNILLIPLYHLAEKWQNDERNLQASMADELALIKRTFKNQERYMMLRTMYRQHGYHPIMAARTSFGFLIQVPFFFAAYHFLSNYAPLNGVSFAGLADLGKPDNLLILGGMAINILPFIMTAVNLISALVYSKKLTKRDKIQLYTIAGLFLVLLYDAAAGLVFYWTCNNIFSLGKNIVYEKFKILEHNTTQQNRNISTAPHPFVLQKYSTAITRLTTAFASALISSAIILCLWFTQHHDCTFPLWGVQICYAFLFFIQMYWIMYIFVQHSEHKITNFFSIVYVIFIIHSIIIISEAAIGQKTHLTTALKDNILIEQGALFLLALFVSYSNKFSFLQKIQFSFIKESYSVLPSALLLFILIFFATTPLKIYTSDQLFFTNGFYPLISDLTHYGIIASIFFILLFKSFTSKVKPIISFLFIAFTITASFYIFLFTIDYGIIDSYHVQFENKIFENYYILFDILSVVTIFSVTYILIQKNKIYMLRSLCILFCFVSAINMAININSVETLILDKSQKTTMAHQQIPTYTNELFSFNKTGVNILVIMLDMFTGDHLGRIANEYPDIAETLDGFVWYPDTITAGGATILSVPSLLGGHASSPYEIYKQNPSVSLEETITQNAAILPQILEKHNFHTSFSGVPYLTQAYLEKHLTKTNFLLSPSLSSALSPLWLMRHASKGLENKDSGAKFTSILALFKACPWSLRTFIYQNGAWLGETRNSYLHSVREYAALDMLPELSNTNTAQNTYKFITNNLTHSPWFVDDKTLFPTKIDPVPETSGCFRKIDGMLPEHYIAEKAALTSLGKWFAWLKKNGVYDNTQIILISDHESRGDSISLATAFGNAHLEGSTRIYPSRPHALLCIKNIGSRGKLKKDDSLMLTSDLQSIIYQSLAPKFAFPDNLKAFPRNWEQGQTRIRYHANGPWNRNLHPKNTFIVNEVYKITGTMFKKENWERVK